MKNFLLMLLMKLLSRLPISFLRGLGALIGSVGLHVSKKSVNRLRNNLLITGMCSLENLDNMTRKTAQEQGKMLVETACIAWHRSREYNAQFFVEAINFELLEAAVAEGRPVVFLTPHIGNFEMALKYTANRITSRHFTVLYKPSKDEWLNKVMVEGRVEENVTPVPINRPGIVALMRALKDKQMIGILPDSIASSGDGVWVKFFGQNVFATTLGAKMSLFDNAATFLVASRRVDGGFVVEYVPYISTSKDIPTIVQETYAEFEKMILKAPTQYYWSYDRFRVPKHAPEIT